MSYFKELDSMIQDRVKYNPETNENESTFLQLRDEVNLHISGELVYEQLSPIAQDVVADWESWCEAVCADRDVEDYAIDESEV